MVDASHELISRAKHGDRDAVGELLGRYLTGLRAFVRLRLGPELRARETSADIVQSICADVLGDLSQFEYRTEAGFRHWLYTRAEHKIVDRARYHRREKRDVARERSLDRPGDADLLAGYRHLFTPSRHASVREEIDRLERAFERLPDDYREVIILSRLVAMPHEEIARVMGRTQQAIWNLSSRALARLATFLEEEERRGPPSGGGAPRDDGPSD